MIHSAEQIASLKEYTEQNIANTTDFIYNGFIRAYDVSIHDAATAAFYLDLIARIKKGKQRRETCSKYEFRRVG